MSHATTMRRLADGDSVSLESLYEVASYASCADERMLTSEWLAIARELKLRADAGPLDESWRYVAWTMGATADFAAGIGLLETLPRDDDARPNAGGDSQRVREDPRDVERGGD